jgi:Bacterial dnaA protein helix-turn-helix
MIGTMTMTEQLSTREQQQQHYAAVRQRLGLRVYTPVVRLAPRPAPAKPEPPAPVLPPEEVRRQREKRIRREREAKLVAMLKTLVKRPNDSTEFNRILIEVADRNSLPYDFVYTRSRIDCIAHARSEFYYLLRTRTKMSYTAIARRVGRDHTTILHGVAQHCLRNGLEYPAS